MAAASRQRPGRRRSTKSYDRQRPSASERGYDHRWRRISQAYLKANPLCQAHLKRGRLVPATAVDHVVPHRGNYDLFWDSSNWQGLCHACHGRKTRQGL